MPRHCEEETALRNDRPSKDDEARHEALRRLGKFAVGMRVRYLVDVGIEVDGTIAQESRDGKAYLVFLDAPLDVDGGRWLSRWATPLWLRRPA
jgi:hypothetical protein